MYVGGDFVGGFVLDELLELIEVGFVDEGEGGRVLQFGGEGFDVSSMDRLIAFSRAVGWSLLHRACAADLPAVVAADSAAFSMILDHASAERNTVRSIYGE